MSKVFITLHPFESSVYFWVRAWVALLANELKAVSGCKIETIKKKMRTKGEKENAWNGDRAVHQRNGPCREDELITRQFK